MVLVPVLQVLLVAFFVSPSPDEDYCMLCSDHTMCKYPNILGKKCVGTGPGNRGMDSNQINTILDVHNKLRNKIAEGNEHQGINGGQPKASNMKKLTWNDELATIAQRWADQCDFHHDMCRKTRNLSWVNQNIALSGSWPCDSLPGPDWSSPINDWYSEVKDFDSKFVSNFESFSDDTGHYTQVAWGRTSMTGCGYTSFFKNEKCYRYYVCNYAPGGNIMEQEMYKIGEPREACKDSPKDPQYPGLCG